MKLRPSDAHVYAFTQIERDAVVLALRGLLDDEAMQASTSKWGIAAAGILERMRAEEGS